MHSLKGLLLLAVLSTSCSSPQPSQVTEPILSGGTALLVDSTALQTLLHQLEAFEDSPLAALAGPTRARTRHCNGDVSGWSAKPELSALVNSLRCDEDPSQRQLPLAAMKELRGEASLVLTIAIEDQGHAIATSHIGPIGSLRGSLSLPLPAPDSPWSLLVPAAQAPEPATLHAETALIYARLRTEGGLRPAAFVPEGSQGDKLMGLKSGLFSGLLFDGSWEFAFYPPGPGELLLPWAASLGVRSRKAAIAGVEAWIEDLSRRWPLTRSPHVDNTIQGVCLRDLNVLPDLAPCYHADERALVIASNDRALGLAVRRTDSLSGEEDQPEPTGFVAHFAQFPAADRALSRSRDAEAEPVSTSYPYARLDVQPTRESRRLVFQFEAKAAPRGAAPAP